MRLDGIRVLDLSRLLPGPYATQQLADLGAEVVKIEHPEMGDYARFAEPTTAAGHGALFDVMNRGKKSLTLDLKSEHGRDIFFTLVEDADVVFEQFRPGVVERLGIGYEDVKSINEEIIYCSLSGFGQEGPYRDRVGHDLNYVGLTGFLDMNRASRDEAPRVPGIPIADMGSGLFVALSVTSALLSRELGNLDGGTYIDISMSDVVLSLSQAIYAESGGTPSPRGSMSTGLHPWYDVYETKDGKYVTLAAHEEKFWKVFCRAVDREDLIDEHLVEAPEARDALRDELAAIFEQRTQAEWKEELGEKEAMFGVVNDMAEAYEDPHFQARGIITDDDNAFPRIQYPANVSTGLDDIEEMAPGMGEHTRSILLDAGLTPEEIASLEEEDIV